MKRMVLLALMLAVLCAGCTLENGTPELGSETEQSVSQEEVSESGPTETELEEAARLEIQMKEVLCYESSHGGAPYEYGQPGFIAWDFGEVYLDLTSNREEPAEEQNALIQTMSGGAEGKVWVHQRLLCRRVPGKGAGLSVFR